MGTGVERLIRKPGSREVSFLELFFDLAIIFALMQLSQRLLSGFGWENSVQTLILVAAVWWIWVAAVRTADWFDPGAPYVQWIITMVMFAGLVVAAAVPGAFGDHGIVFAGAYVVILLGRHLAIIRALQNHPLQIRSVRAAIWFGAGGILWVAGALVPSTPRLVLWSAAVIVDYLGVVLGWPVPGLDRVPGAHLKVLGDHIAERHRQVFIVGLGELILAGGISLAQQRPDALRTVAFALAFVNAALMLWSYLVPRGLDLADVLNRRPPYVSVLCSFAHGLMIAGIVATAMADDVLIRQPLEDARDAWSVALVAGPFLYLAGRTMLVSVVFQRPVWRAPAGMVVLAAVSPVLLSLPLIAGAAVVNAVLLGVILSARIGEPVVRRLGSLQERLLRKRERSDAVSFHELFFDLGLIFALIQIAQRLLGDLSVTNAAQTTVLFAAIWWIWVATAWSTDWFNPDEPYLQRLIIGVMFAGLLMAVAVPRAFGADGLLFAGAYSAINIGRGLAIVPVLRGSPLQARSGRVLIWFSISAVPWLVGAFLPAGPRLILWAVAIVVDGAISWFGWPVPGLSRVPERQLRVIGEHIAERYRQIYIVALGVPILVSGLSYSASGFDYVRTLAFAIAFVSAVMLVWIYVLPLGRNLGTVVNANAPRAAIAASYSQGIMIAGVVAIAVGDALLIRQPLGETRTAWSVVIVGGVALHITGRILLNLVFGAHRPWRAVAALLAVGAMTPGLLVAPPLVVASAVNTALVFIVFSYRRLNRPARPAPT
ncbi:low temperature requirement protein A [Micromonospora sp. NPDC049523]|uniref:low temperature requirement protein A n=1 Tax=Micromonospora sp. NPDC049523 TaxID=3155921 RepID=UPI00343F951A